MNSLRIVFMGTADFAVPSLERLHQSRHEVLAVVTAPDLPRGRGQKISFTPVKSYAVEHNIPVLQPSAEKGALRLPAFLDQLGQFRAEVFMVVAFRILPAEVFEMPLKGCVNLHASLLPKYRGAAPINWAIIRGEEETGVTTFFIQQQVDTGNIILQRRLRIRDDETAGELHDRLAELGAETLLETADRISSGPIQALAQNEGEVTTAPKIFKETCRINWNQPAAQIRNFIRGLSPYPAALACLQGEFFKIFSARLADHRLDGLSPGTVSVHRDQLMVVCANGEVLEILEWQPPSKKRMSMSEYLRGHSLTASAAFS